MKYETRITRLTVVPAGEPLFALGATDIEITDEAAGEYLIVTQHHEEDVRDGHKVLIGKDDWPAIRDAIDRMISECREEK